MNIKTINKLPWPENLLRRVFYDVSYDEWKKSIISSLRVMETLYYMRLYLSKCYPKCADYITKIPLDASRNGTEGGYYHAAMRFSSSFIG